MFRPKNTNIQVNSKPAFPNSNQLQITKPYLNIPALPPLEEEKEFLASKKSDCQYFLYRYLRDENHHVSTLLKDFPHIFPNKNTAHSCLDRKPHETLHILVKKMNLE